MDFKFTEEVVRGKELKKFKTESLVILSALACLKRQG